jgi:Chaperone of endosialidase
MKFQKSFALVIFAVVILACSQATPSQTKFATESSAGSSVRWDVSAANAGGTLTVTAPDGRVFRKTFPAGSVADFTLVDNQGERLPDGSYTYELRLTPILSRDAKATLKASRANDDDPEADRVGRKRASLPGQAQSGSFSIMNGQAIVAGAVEGQRIGKATDPLRGAAVSGNTLTRLRNHSLSLRAMPDQVIPDDLIVQGSACIGLDCVNNESFGFDTIRLKENNTRIKFDDTSTSAGFPTHDWQLTANDSASGGAEKFSIEDITAATVPFTVRGSAPNNSIFVDSSGRLGLRTSNPVLDIHANTSNTPAMRLEQNNSGGFVAQTWDIAGNEANFFVRDVTGGSRLPFRIRPGAPTSSVDIAASGNVGIGTASPTQQLHVLKSGANTSIGITVDSNFDGALVLNQSGNVQWNIHNAATTGNLSFEQGAGVSMLIQKTTGNVGIGTTSPGELLSVNGSASKPGGGTWSVPSDERLKNIKGNFNTGLKAVMQLQPIRYHYRKDNAMGLKSETENIGFGAQSLQKVIPEAVTMNSVGYLQVNSDPILWTMLNAIKEQQKEIAELKAQVQKLRTASHRRRK